jgi:putative membrane protein
VFDYNYIKALHIIFVVNWFAGLFYMPRLFIYATEANEKPEPDKSILVKQLQLMQRKLWYIITWPSAVITLCLAVWLLVRQPVFFTTWLDAYKNWLLYLDFIYTMFSLHSIFSKQQKGIFKQSSTQLRIWNEVATIFLFAIVFFSGGKNQPKFF